MDDYREAYNVLMKEFLSYQALAEEQIQILNEKNIKLEKSLDVLFNIVEVSKYINSYLSSKNITQRINDMIIGILGATYSSIYLKEEERFVIKASNFIEEDFNILEGCFLDSIKNNKSFVLNSTSSVYPFGSVRKEHICSVIGVPIKLRHNLSGYIIVEHTHCNFFSDDHIKFIESIANQIAIALENSLLYRKIRESSKRDSFLNIYNRKYFVDFLIKRIEKSSEDFAIVMIDLDDFKIINDTCGHLFGDVVLSETVRLIEKNIAGKDLLARYGGEELILYINKPHSKDQLFEKIYMIKESIANNQVHYRGITRGVTASFGISVYPQDAVTVEELLFIADENLYKAKELGKNKVIISEDFQISYGS